MTAISEAFRDTTSIEKVQQPTAPKAVTLESYFRRFRDREDGFKYELVDGAVEKTPRTMTPAQVFILNNLMRRFTATKAYRTGANLFVEIEMNTKPDQVRKPDICYRSAEQIASVDFSVSEFVVEIVSPNDKVQKAKLKIREYFAAGVQVIWQVHPDAEEIEVYTSARHSDVYSGGETVDAAPAIPDFSMAVEAVFRKPVIAGK